MAITSDRAFLYLKKIDGIISKIKVQVSCNEDEILERIEKTLINNKEKDKEIDRLTKENQKYRINELISNSTSHSEVKLIISKENKISNIKDFGDRIREYCLESFIAVIGMVLNDKPMIMCVVSSDIQDKISAKELVSSLAEIIDGGGGGKDSIATAGGKNIEKLDEALKKSVSLAKALLDERL